MSTTLAPGELRKAVTDAVRLVNANSGRAAVRLMFGGIDPPVIDFIANSGNFQGDRFVFTAGFETYDGRLDELVGIEANVIRH